jgi:hypothetical protein
MEITMKKMSLLILLVALMMVLVGPTTVLADSPTFLGGLHLREYCVAQGYADVTLTGPIVGPSAAFNNWRCVTPDGGTHPFSMEQACKWEYNINESLAHPLDSNNAFSWVCYSVQH